MRHRRVDVRPEAVLGILQRLPEALRPLVGEADADDRLDRLEAVFPRRRQAQGRAVLRRQRLAVDAGHQEGEIVGRLGDGQALDVGPGIPAGALARGDIGILEGLHLDELGVARGPGEIDQGLQGEAAPRHRHRPGLDAAMAIEPLLQRHLGEQVIDADGDRLLDLALDRHRPGPQRQRLRVVLDLLAGAEFVVVVVAGGELLVGDRPVELVGLVPLHRIELGGGIGRRLGPGPSGAERAGRQQDRAGGDSLHQPPAIGEHRLGRRGRFRQLPLALDPDLHGSRPLECAPWRET